MNIRSEPVRPGQRARRSQRGSTLIIAVILLLILSVATIFALQVGVQEQRTSGNDLRARITSQVAAAGLGHATETFRANSATWLFTNPGQSPDPALWAACTAADTSFPCGAIPAADRVGQYYFIGGTAGSTFGNREIPLAPIAGDASLAGSRLGFTNVSGFPVQYSVGAVICTLTAPPNSVCTTNPNLRSGVGVVTLVSRAQMTGETATATQTKSIGVYRIINIPPNTPPIVAGGLLDGLGNATIVSNPNSAGNGAGSGVPVAIWSRYGINGAGGSWQTCQTEEFFRNGDPVVQGTETPIVTCDNCSCPAEDIVSGGTKGSQDDGGGGGTWTRGFDVLDPRAPTDIGETGVLASDYFPCDTFEYIFGVRARKEGTSPDVPYPVCTGSEAEDDEDDNDRTDRPDDFLEANFTQVDDCGDDLLAKIDERDGGGFYWHKGGDACEIKGTVGSADDPIVLVTEGEIDLDTSTEFFGLLFARDVRPTLPNTRAGMDAYGGPGIKPGGGGGAMVYGALIIDGGGKANAGITVVGNNAILEKLGEDDSNRRVGGPLARSWTDSVSY